jgi:hypothetical protein
MSKAGKVVEAECFVLKDMHGNVRAELSLRSGSPSLIMYGENKKRRLEIILNDDGAGLLLFDESGHCRLQACLEQDRPGIVTPSISVGGPRGEGGIVLYVGPDAQTGILFLDKEHKPILDFSSSASFNTRPGEPR